MYLIFRYLASLGSRLMAAKDVAVWYREDAEGRIRHWYLHLKPGKDFFDIAGI